MSKYNKYEFMYEFVIFDNNPLSFYLDDFKKVKFYKALKSDNEALEFHTKFVELVSENDKVEEIYEYYVRNTVTGGYIATNCSLVWDNGKIKRKEEKHV